MSSIWVKFQPCLSYTINLFLLQSSWLHRDSFCSTALLANKWCTSHNISRKCTLFSVNNSGWCSYYSRVGSPKQSRVQLLPFRYVVMEKESEQELLYSYWNLFRAFPLIFVLRLNVLTKQGKQRKFCIILTKRMLGLNTSSCILKIKKHSENNCSICFICEEFHCVISKPSKLYENLPEPWRQRRH